MADTARRVRPAEIKTIRSALLKAQDWICPLCGKDLRNVRPQQRAVDHDHKTGAIRGVLCSNCNGSEGRVLKRVQCAKHNLNVIEWLENLLNYWKHHAVNRTGLLHPTFKTDEEKRLIKNQKAREYRARKKIM